MSEVLPVPDPRAHLQVFRTINPDYVAVFVEGPDDFHMWKPWLKWRPVPAGGCKKVRSVIETLRATGAEGYIGIVDADCSRLEDIDYSAGDLIVSQHHDLECDILQTAALERLFAQANDDDLAKMLGGHSIREAIVKRALPFGLFRWHCYLNNIEYSEGRFSPNIYLDTQWVLDYDRLLSDVANACSIPANQLEISVEQLRQRGAPVWSVCNGHDVLKITYSALHGPLDLKNLFPSVKSVMSGLRLSVHQTLVEEMHIWKSLCAWEQGHAPWQCIRR